MSEHPEETAEISGRGHGHKPTERRDIASGEIMPRRDMIRMAFGPDGMVVPDFSCKLPGRGAWVEAKRAAVEIAIKKKAFARSAKHKVDVPDDFVDLIEAGLSARVLGLLSMAKKAGGLEIGFDKVRGAAAGGLLAYRFEARDGSEDGRGKIRVLAKSAGYELGEAPAACIGCFDGAALGKIMGREHTVHIGVKKGRMAKALEAELIKLAGFTDLIPQEWPDKDHEGEFPGLEPTKTSKLPPETGGDEIPRE